MNDGSLQGFELFRWNDLFAGTAKLYDSTKRACTSNIIPFVLEFEHAFSSIGEFLLTNIYLLQTCMIPYNGIIRTRKQKLNANNKFFRMAISLPGYFIAINHDVE